MSEEMTLVLFGITVLCTLISCGAGVASYIFSSRPASVEMQNQLDELTGFVESTAKTIRKEKMRNVRLATKDSGCPDGSSDGSQGSMLGAVEQLTTKQALRKRLLTRR